MIPTWMMALFSVLALLVGAYFSYSSLTGAKTKMWGKNKNKILAAGILMIAFGGSMLWFGGLADRYAGVGEAGPYSVGVPMATTGTQQPTQVVTTTQPLAVTPTQTRMQINTFAANLKEFGTNKWDSIGNASDGFINIYPAEQDPRTPNTQYLTRVNISSGTGSDTTGKITTDTPYRVVFDGSGTYYDYDWGVITFDYADFTDQTGTYIFQFGDDPDELGIYTIATIDDFMNCTDTGGDIFNGQSTNNAAQELYGSDDDTIYYNETTGDGEFYIKPTFSVSGANKVTQEAVLCFEHDTSNPPEGTEISSIAVSNVEGAGTWITESDLVEFWSKEECVDMFSFAKGGSSQKYKFTFTVDETALDANDVWKMYMDDLGSIRGKDNKLNTGSAGDYIQVDSYNA